MKKEFSTIVGRLCEASRKDYSNPYLFDWPERLNPDSWFYSPEMISLYGTPFFLQLTEAEQKRLSFFEAVNFFSLNIHGEKILVEGLTKRLYRNEEITPYLHHFLDEENKHMVYFGEFCLRYAGKIYRDKKVPVIREYDPGEKDFLFFAQVLIFEEIVDFYNVSMSRDERLDPLVRRIHMLHHRDEARHLVFGRNLVSRLAEKHFPKWPVTTRQRVREQLRNFFVETWREYYNPDVYSDAGFSDPYVVYSETFDSNTAVRFRHNIENSIKWLPVLWEI